MTSAYTTPFQIRAIQDGICPKCRTKKAFIDLESERIKLKVHICTNCDEKYALFKEKVSMQEGVAEAARLIQDFFNRGIV